MNTFVYKRGDQYLRYNERTTHTGTHRSAHWDPDINLATVWYGTPGYMTRQIIQVDESERVEVQVVRTVTIVN